MLKKMILFCSALVLAVAIQAQSVDDIINNYIANTGGADKWKSLKATKANANFSMSGFEFPGVMYNTNTNKMRVNVNVQGMEIVQAYDGQTGWMINPFMGGQEPQKMPAEQVEEMAKQEFESPFIDYQNKGHKVELLGEETVDGTATYKVKLSKKNGDVEFYFFDKENYVPIMSKRAVTSGPAKGQEAETYYSDYQEVNGLILPFYTETKIGGQSLQKIVIKSVELNPAVDESMFAFPEKDKPAKKKK